jgi:16S rRNA (adenine1518-N6/adenine1519-N6)-dimethyltransferase
MVFARKRFGQHFLHDPATRQRIVDAVGASRADALVEIGPGRGALTRLLRERAGSLDAIEIDRDLAAALEAEYATDACFTLHRADALRFDFAALAQARGQRLRIVGNLPYNVSTPLLFHLLDTHAAIADLHVMLQREVIERIVAAPGSEHYGRLGVMLAPWVEAEHLFDVGPGAFQPPPRVWSAVARLRVRPEPAFALDARYGKLVTTAFSARRKTLRNACRGLLEPGAIEAAGIDPGARPETLSPAQFGALAQRMPSG